MEYLLTHTTKNSLQMNVDLGHDEINSDDENRENIPPAVPAAPEEASSSSTSSSSTSSDDGDGTDLEHNLSRPLFEVKLAHRKAKRRSPSVRATDGQSCQPAAKRRLFCPIQERIAWMKKNAYRPPAQDLREKSALALAQSWSNCSEVAEEMAAMGRSPMAMIFKAEVGVFLKGHHLVVFIRKEGGLNTLAQNCWPGVFQRLLTAVYAEIARFDQDPVDRKDLSRCVRVFREKTEKRAVLQTAVHRLGLTECYDQRALESLERRLFDFYEVQADRCKALRLRPVLIYPLPPVLRVDPAESTDLIALHCPLHQCIRKKEQEWRQTVSPKARWNEERGLELSEETVLFRQKGFKSWSKWSQVQHLPVSRRHVLLLTMMAQSYFQRTPQLTVVAGFMALTHPFYSAERIVLDEPEVAPVIRSLRVDIFWFLARGLSLLHASLDLPLACLEKAKNEVLNRGPQPPCVSEQARLALMTLEIHVRYGHYTRAREIFWNWFGRFPSPGWLFEELVMIHTAGVLSSVQDKLVEIYLTEGFHFACSRDLPCWEDFVKPMAHAVKNKILPLQSILHCCLSNLSLREDFRDDCKNALQICSLYTTTVAKILSRHRFNPAVALQLVHSQIQWGLHSQSSVHLKPFEKPLPSHIEGRQLWIDLVERDYLKLMRLILQNSSCSANSSRMFADSLFTLLVSLLFLQSRYDTKEVIWETLMAYEKSTAGRHYRIPLLTQLLRLKTSPKEMELNAPAWIPELDGIDSKIKGDSVVHPEAARSQLTADDLTASATRKTAETTMQDCLEDFKCQDLSSDEKFCSYLRKKDEMMPAWIDFGLKCFRFDHTCE